MNYDQISIWYSYCIMELNAAFGDIQYNNQKFNYIQIYSFPMPGTFVQPITTLLIKTPGYNIEQYAQYFFYMAPGLKRKDNQEVTHLFEKRGYNDKYDKNWAKMCFHLHDFRPSFPPEYGDRIFDITQSLYNWLGTKW